MKNQSHKNIKQQAIAQGREKVTKKQRPIDLIRVLVKENKTLTIKVVQHWLNKRKSG